MFANSFQSGPHVQVFDSKVNKQKNQFYNTLVKYINPNTIKKQFDKQIKSYILEIEGLSRLMFPKDEQKELCLVQRYLVLQVFVPVGFPWSIQLGLTDTTKTKRRVMLTSAINKIQSKFFHVRCPIDNIKRGVWLNLGIDVYSYMQAFKGQTFRSLDQITIGANCKFRRMFTMKDGLIEYSNDDEFFDYSSQEGKVFLPKQFQLNPDVIQSTQVISYDQYLPKDEHAKTSIKPMKNVSNNSGQKKIQTNNNQIRRPSFYQKQKKQSIVEVEKAPIQPSRTMPIKKAIGIKSKIDTGLNTSSSSSTVKSNNTNKLNARQPSRFTKQNQQTIPQNQNQDGEQQFSIRAQQLRKQLEKYQDQDFQPIQNVKAKKHITLPSKDPKFATQINYAKQQSIHESIDISPQKLVKQVHEQQTEKPSATKYQEYEQEYDYGDFQDSMQNKQQTNFQDSMDPKVPLKQSVYNKIADNMFPTSIITKKNKQTVVVEIKPQTEVDLIYDPVLECYYNPQTNTYYELS